MKRLSFPLALLSIVFAVGSAACAGSADDGDSGQSDSNFTAGSSGQADPETAKQKETLEQLVASKEWGDGKTSLKLTDRTSRRFTLKTEGLSADGTWQVDIQESSGAFGPLVVLVLKVNGGRETSLMISPDTCPSTGKPARALVAPGPSPDESMKLFAISECAPKKK